MDIKSEMEAKIELVEILLKESEYGLHKHQLKEEADLSDAEVTRILKVFVHRGQIELIPASGKDGPRYAWLEPISKPEPVEPLAPASEIKYDMLEALEEIEQETEKILQSRADVEEPPSQRYLLTVPKRKPRIMTCAQKAQEAAQAAVRNGSNRAEVYVLTHIGTATRGVFWDSIDGNNNGIS